MRITLVSLHTSPALVPGRGDAGGMNVVVAESAAALVSLGHEVEIVTRRTDRESDALSHLASGVRLRVLDAGDPVLPKSSLPGVLPEFTAAMSKLPASEVLHAHYWLSGVAAAPVARQQGARFAVTLHTVAAQKNALLAPGDTPEPEHRLAAERHLVRQGLPIAVSSSEAAAISSGYGIAAGDIRVVTPGVDTEIFTPEAGGGAPNGDWLAMIGRVQPLKGQDLAIRALAEARRRLGSDSTLGLLLAGEAGPEHAEFARGLSELVDELGLTDHVRFLPGQSRADTAALLAGSRLALVPSHNETFGLVALEAAACGTPALAPDHTGFRESVRDGVSGRLLPDRNPETWGTAIAELIADQHALAALSGTARSYALEHRWLDSATRLVEAYETATPPSP